MSSVITGEAVVLELRPAAFGARFLGALIDIVVQLVVLLLVFLAFAGVLGGALDAALTRTVVIVVLLLVLVGLPVTVETLTRGKSLGRLVMGLRIVRDDGGSIRFRHAFIRGTVAVLEIYIMAGAVAFVVAIFNERSKRVGDILAGTYSMRERYIRQAPVLAVTPPHLQQWVVLADMARLPDSLGRRLTTFSSQAPRMTVAARRTLSVELANETSAYVSPAPPQGTTPEEFLQAVTAQRRERDFSRLSAQRERLNAASDRLHKLPFSQ